MLTLTKVNKHYGKKHALVDFSFTFETGVYTLLVPNGAGKSTLMNILTDTLNPDEGSEVLYNGTSIWEAGKDYRAKVGFMPQQQGMPGAFSARTFMSYMAALKDVNAQQARRQIAGLLRQVELFDVIDKKIDSFSGGMKQRLLFAQALLGDPEILILDEPTAGLDPRQRVIMRGMIQSLAGYAGKTILLSTHILSDVEQIADQVLIMKEGRLMAAGTVEQLTAQLPAEKEKNLEQVYMTYFGER